MEQPTVWSILVMKNRNLQALALAAASLAVASSVPGQPPPPRITPSQAGSHLGRVVTVCGVVVAISCSGDDRRLWFTMDEPYWGGVSIVVGEAERAALGARPGRFMLQPSCATGKIDKHSSGFLVETRPGDLQQVGPPSKVPPGFAGDSAYTMCDEGVSPPTLVRDVQPNYTVEAMQAKKQGKALLHAVVLPDGRVGDIVVAVSLDREYGLDAEAVRAVKGWFFKPGTRLGLPVPVMVSVEMAFTLRKKQP